MALLGFVDGDNASTGHGYLDIVDFHFTKLHQRECQSSRAFFVG